MSGKKLLFEGFNSGQRGLPSQYFTSWFNKCQTNDTAEWILQCSVRLNVWSGMVHLHWHITMTSLIVGICFVLMLGIHIVTSKGITAW